VPTPTPTPLPTIVVDEQEIPDPHFSNLELFNLEKANAPIPQFVHALNLAGVDVDASKISKSLTYRAIKAKNGDSVVVLLTTDLPETSYNEGGIPLLVYMPNIKTGKYGWGVAWLKDVGSLHGILMGALINSAEEMDLNDRIGIFTNNFNMATIPYSSIDVPRDIMDGQTKYRLSRIAKEDLREIMWFALGSAADARVFEYRDEAVAFVNNEMDEIVRKYGNRITIANILNELNPTASRPSYRMWRTFGDDYLISIYQHAREILPNAKLIYNETYNYTKTHEGTTYPYTVKVVNALKPHNLIDAVGMQMHMAQNIWALETPIDVDETVDIMRSFGLPVYVTELDVNQTPMTGTEQEKLIQQADIYEKIVRACVRSQVCELINFWGQTDPWSWYENPLGELNAEACIFDDDGAPKLAYYAVLRGLMEGFVP
jgi:hypothetical protein